MSETFYDGDFVLIYQWNYTSSRSDVVVANQSNPLSALADFLVGTSEISNNVVVPGYLQARGIRVVCFGLMFLK